MEHLQAQLILEGIDWHDAVIQSISASCNPDQALNSMPWVDVVIRTPGGLVLLRLHQCSDLSLGFGYDLKLSCKATPSGRVQVFFNEFCSPCVCEGVDVYMLIAAR